MNDWSARTLQMEEMKLNLGPAKGKDFATTLGPILVTRDELAKFAIPSRERRAPRPSDESLRQRQASLRRKSQRHVLDFRPDHRARKLRRHAQARRSHRLRHRGHGMFSRAQRLQDHRQSMAQSPATKWSSKSISSAASSTASLQLGQPTHEALPLLAFHEQLACALGPDRQRIESRIRRH